MGFGRQRLPAHLLSWLQAGGRVLLCSRWSAGAGPPAREHAVKNIYTTARNLASLDAASAATGRRADDPANHAC